MVTWLSADCAGRLWGRFITSSFPAPGGRRRFEINSMFGPRRCSMGRKNRAYDNGSSKNQNAVCRFIHAQCPGGGNGGRLGSGARKAKRAVRDDAAQASSGAVHPGLSQLFTFYLQTQVLRFSLTRNRLNFVIFPPHFCPSVTRLSSTLSHIQGIRHGAPIGHHEHRQADHGTALPHTLVLSHPRYRLYVACPVPAYLDRP